MLTEDLMIQCIIPAGKTIREAKTALHLFTLQQQKRLDERIISKQREELRRVTKKENFVQNGLQAHTRQKSSWEELDLDLEDDETDLRGINTVALTARLHAIYKKTVDKIAADVQRKKEQEARTQQSKAQLIEKVSRTSPEDLLNQTIDDRIAATLRKKQPVSRFNNSALFVAATSSGIDAATVEKNFSVLPKNESSPATGGGKDKGKGKGKGKTQRTAQLGQTQEQQGKAKGKSKIGGRGNSKGRGDGRGKGRGGRGGKNRQPTQ